MSDIETRVGKIVKTAESRLSPLTFISSTVRKMERSDVDELAIAYLFAQVKIRKRAEVRSIEQAAARQREVDVERKFGPKRRTKAWYEWLETPDGAQAKAIEAEWERREDERVSRLFADLNDSIEKYGADLRMEWTAELLSSEFALADGSKITWGEATREQHEWRADMHTRNAVAGIEGAARHRAAIDELERTGAETLNAAVRVAA